MRWPAHDRHSSKPVGGAGKMIYGQQLIFREFQMLKSLSVVVLLLVASPALAEVVSSPAAQAAKARDPNRKICEPVEETGSRLSSKRICMTAAQWEAQRSKTERPKKNAGDRTGK